MPADAAYGVFEIGMNHAGEITPLVKMVRPHVAIVTTVAASHLGHFSSLAEIADAKAEIFSGVDPGGHAVINRDNAIFRPARRSRAKGRHCEYRRLRPPCPSRSEARTKSLFMPIAPASRPTILGEAVIYKLGVPGEHMVLNSLAVLAAVKLAGADLARASLALGRGSAGQGPRRAIAAQGAGRPHSPHR